MMASKPPIDAIVDHLIQYSEKKERSDIEIILREHGWKKKKPSKQPNSSTTDASSKLFNNHSTVAPSNACNDNDSSRACNDNDSSRTDRLFGKTEAIFHSGNPKQPYVAYDRNAGSYTETKARKKHSHHLFLKKKYEPSVQLVMAGMRCFTRRHKKHFFQDGLYLSTAFSHELGVPIRKYINLRGWKLVRNNKSDRKKITVSFRKMEEGFIINKIHADKLVSYYNVNAVTSLIFTTLQSDSSLVDNLFFGDGDGIEGTDDSDHDGDEQISVSNNILFLGMHRRDHSNPDLYQSPVLTKEQMIDLLNLRVTTIETLIKEGAMTKQQGRDTARCLAVESKHKAGVITLSLDGVKSPHHVVADFNSRNVESNIRNVIGDDVKFSQIALDYFYMPASWHVDHWKPSFFTSTLPILSKFLDDPVDKDLETGLPTGLIFLPFCLHTLTQVLGNLKSLETIFEVNCRTADDVKTTHALYSASLDFTTYQMESLGKELNQLDRYCTLTRKDVEASFDDGFINRTTILNFIDSLPTLEDIRFIELRKKPSDLSSGVSFPPQKKVKLLTDRTSTPRGFGDHSRSYVFQKNSGIGKRNTIHEVQAASYGCVQMIYSKTFCDQVRNSPRFYDSLWVAIFHDCVTKRLIVEGCLDLCMFCSSESSLYDKRSTLQDWATNDPGSILQNARSNHTVASVSAYRQQVLDSIDKICHTRVPRNGAKLPRLTVHATLRYAVLTLYDRLQKSSGRTSQSNLVAYNRNSDLLAIAKMNSTNPVPKVSKNVLSMMKNSSFFNEKIAQGLYSNSPAVNKKANETTRSTSYYTLDDMDTAGDGVDDNSKFSEDENDDESIDDGSYSAEEGTSGSEGDWCRKKCADNSNDDDSTVKPIRGPTAKPNAKPLAKPTPVPTARPPATSLSIPPSTNHPTHPPTNPPTCPPTTPPTCPPTTLPTDPPTTPPITRPPTTPPTGPPTTSPITRQPTTPPICPPTTPPICPPTTPPTGPPTTPPTDPPTTSPITRPPTTPPTCPPTTSPITRPPTTPPICPPTTPPICPPTTPPTCPPTTPPTTRPPTTPPTCLPTTPPITRPPTTPPICPPTTHRDNGCEGHADKEIPMFSGLKMASETQVQAIHHRLVVHDKVGSGRTYLYHGPHEVYHTWSLHEREHCYENTGTRSPFSSNCYPTFVPMGAAGIIGPQGDYAKINDVTVVRPRHPEFQIAFKNNAAFSFDMNIIMNAIVDCSHSDSSRSDGFRMDFGCAGQSHVIDPRTGKRNKPAPLYGTSKLDRHKHGEYFRTFIGMIGAGVSYLSEFICREEGKPYDIDINRFRQYASTFGLYLYTNDLIFENIGVQLLKLKDGQREPSVKNPGQKGHTHFDSKNDCRVIYDRCSAWVGFFTNSDNDLYSLKLIFSFRKAIGDFLSTKYSSIQSVLANVRSYCSDLDKVYSDLRLNMKTTFPDAGRCTWNHPQHLYLSDGCPWEVKHLYTNEGIIEQQYFKLKTGAQRNYWFSAGLHPIYLVSESLQLSGVVQLLVLLCLNNSFEKFGEVIKRMDFSSEDARLYPIYEYQRVAKKLFFSVNGDAVNTKGKKKKSNTSQYMWGGANPRYSSGSVNFEKIFGTKQDGQRGKVDKLVKHMFKLLSSMNELLAGLGKTDKVDPERIKTLLEKTNNDINKDVGKLQMKLVRLLLFVQAAGHIGVGLKPHKRIRDIIVPMKGSGGYEHVADNCIGQTDDSINATIADISHDLLQHSDFLRADSIEALLCESKGGRRCIKYDVFYIGQYLFAISLDGAPILKRFGNTTWEPLNLQWGDIPL